MDSIECTFRVFVTDEEEFKKQVAEYAECEPDEITEENIAEFIREKINPASSNSTAFQVEGGDTDGWFVDGVRIPNFTGV